MPIDHKKSYSNQISLISQLNKEINKKYKRRINLRHHIRYFKYSKIYLKVFYISQKKTTTPQGN